MLTSRSYYKEHKAEFNLIETAYHLAQILVTTQPNPQMKSPNKAQNEADARKKIQMVENRLDSGEDFAYSRHGLFRTARHRTERRRPGFHP